MKLRRMMNNNSFRQAMLSLLLAFSFTIVASAKDVKTVEMGMTKDKVTAIVGKPMTTSFNATGERWTYEKTRGGVFQPYEVRITVMFDNNGRVVEYNEEKIGPKPSPVAVQPRPVACVKASPSGSRHHLSMSDNSFNILMSKVKGASFTDRKFDLIEVACLGCRLTCSQAVALMSEFSFADEKLKALQFVAPRLVDLQNASTIYNHFTFDSEKDKAAEIISKAKR